MIRRNHLAGSVQRHDVNGSKANCFDGCAYLTIHRSTLRRQGRFAPLSIRPLCLFSGPVNDGTPRSNHPYSRESPSAPTSPFSPTHLGRRNPRHLSPTPSPNGRGDCSTFHLRPRGQPLRPTQSVLRNTARGGRLTVSRARLRACRHVSGCAIFQTVPTPPCAVLLQVGLCRSFGLALP